MIIIDRRSWLERAVQRRESRAFGWPGRLAGALADRAAARRVARRAAPTDRAFVVSIGNLRVGGTGKTPVALQLAQDLARRGLTGAVLTRGYGSEAAGPLRVDADDIRAGDEARLLAARLAGCNWPVVQARRRDRGLVWIRQQFPDLDMVLLEDGYQTGGVGRHVDVLILDVWEQTQSRVFPRTGCVLPLGPYRETARGADRADVWLLESASLPPSTDGDDPVVTGFQRRLRLEAQSAGTVDPAGAVHALICGLARPNSFEEGCVGLVNGRIALSVRHGDHCRYHAGLVEHALAAGRRHGVEHWITTAKDWVKLAPLWPRDVPISTAELDVFWTGKRTLPDIVEERLSDWRFRTTAASRR